MTRALAATLFAALVLIPAAGTHAIKDGGTFRVALVAGLFQTIDPALATLDKDLLRPACGALMGYPNKPLPAGSQLKPELADDYPKVSSDRKTYTFTIRKDARFSDGKPVTAGAFLTAFERIFDPKMQADDAGFFEAVVGARKMLAGKETRLGGVVASGRVLRVRLTSPVPDLPARMSLLCAVPAGLPADPEGAKAPLPSPAPYYVASYVPGEQLVMERNRFYRGNRPQHVNRITFDINADVSAVDDVVSGKLDHVVGTPHVNPRLDELVSRYGINKSQVFVAPGKSVRMFFLNTRRPLFKNNPELRQALNFAVDRRALAREYGRYAATATDQYLPPAVAGFKGTRIYPLRGPNLQRARALANGHRRSGKAVLYTCSDRPDCIGVAQVLQQNLEAIGIEVEIAKFPFPVMLEKLATPGEPYDLTWLGIPSLYGDPSGFFEALENFSKFRSPKYDRLLAAAGRLSGPARSRAYGELDVEIASDEAPAIAAMNPNTWAFVSARTGCVVMNPTLDLTAVCLK